MTVWASQHIRAAWDHNANQALKGPKGFDRKRKALQRSVLPAEQPADPERGDNRRIRLGFDLVAQPCL